MAKAVPRFDCPPGVELSRLLTIRSTIQAHAFIVYDLKVPLAFNFVRAAAKSGQLPSKRMGHARYFSTQDIFDWVASLSDLAPDGRSRYVSTGS